MSWTFKVALLLNTHMGPIPIDSIVSIEGDKTLVIMQCLVTLFVYLHIAPKICLPFQLPLGIQVCHVDRITLEFFLSKNQIFVMGVS